MLLLRSLLALAVGYFAKGLIAGILLVAVGWQHLEEPPQRVLVVLTFWRVVASVVAGYVTGVVAGRSEIMHAAVLAAVAFLVALGSMLAGIGGKEPLWTQIAHLVVLGPLILIGGYLRRLQVAYAREPNA